MDSMRVYGVGHGNIEMDRCTPLSVVQTTTIKGL
jgi:hypothetical protein